MFDSFIVEFDRALRTVFAAAPTVRTVPGAAAGAGEPALSASDKAHAAALMRVNHVGEVCAQGLYQGQSLTCRDAGIKRALGKAADEEVEHLAWTERRVHELGGRTSVLNPLWYLGALALGATAGALGDAWSLGFLAETEKQVGAHLDRHLGALPSGDIKSRLIVEQMKLDEAEHAETAVRLGARELPSGIKAGMRLVARGVTTAAYYL